MNEDNHIQNLQDVFKESHQQRSYRTMSCPARLSHDGKGNIHKRYRDEHNFLRFNGF